MEVIFLFGTVQAFFLSVLIFTKKNKSTGDYILGAWMIFIGIHLLDYYINATGFALSHPHLLGLGVNFPILEGAFMFVYVLVMIDKEARFKLKYLFHALPFILLTVYFMFDCYFLSAAEKLEYYNSVFTNPNIAIRISSYLNAFLGPVYVIWSLIKLRNHTHNLTEEFSYTEDVNLNWLKYVLSGLGFVWIVVLISSFNIFSFVFPQYWNTHIIYFAVTAVVFFLGFFGFKQQAIFTNNLNHADSKCGDIIQNEVNTGRYIKSGLSEKKAREYLKNLLKYMEEERPYLNNKLNIRDVACYLDISVNHLSQVINGQLGVSFFDLINKFRTDEVKVRMADQKYKHYTLLAIAFESGFNSKSSFNSIFKKNTGYTPSEYLKTVAG